MKKFSLIPIVLTLSSLLNPVVAQNIRDPSPIGVLNSTGPAAVSELDEKYTAQYSGKNSLSLCTYGVENPQCSIVTMPEEVGHVKEVVYGKFSDKYEASWLAFTDEKVSLCIAEGIELAVRCTPVGLTNYAGIDVSFERKTGIPTLAFSSKNRKKEYINFVAQKFVSRIYSAAEKLESEKRNSSASKGIASPQAEEQPLPPDIPIIEIFAPFPSDSFGHDGGFVLIPVMLGDPQSLPDPLPDGVAPGDILNARDPVGMAACTAGYYRVYVTMSQGCIGLRSATQTRVCLERSILAYSNNLRTECYDKYFY